MNKDILLEDDEKLAALIQRYLQQNHYDLEVIHDGNLAVDAILSAKPDLVILDLMLPGTDGLSICRRIRAQFRGSIIFLTASEDDMDHVAGVELGADDFTIKPIQPRVLLARIRMLLCRNVNNEPPLEHARTFDSKKHFSYDSSWTGKKGSGDTIGFDPKHLERAIGNLVSNAEKYADSKVHIHVEQLNHITYIYVDDDGSGITARERIDILPRLGDWILAGLVPRVALV